MAGESVQTSQSSAPHVDGPSLPATPMPLTPSTPSQSAAVAPLPVVTPVAGPTLGVPVQSAVEAPVITSGGEAHSGGEAPVQSAAGGPVITPVAGPSIPATMSIGGQSAEAALLHNTSQHHQIAQMQIQSSGPTYWDHFTPPFGYHYQQYPSVPQQPSTQAFSYEEFERIMNSEIDDDINQWDEEKAAALRELDAALSIGGRYYNPVPVSHYNNVDLLTTGLASDGSTIVTPPLQTTPLDFASSTVNVMNPASNGTGVQPALNTPIFPSPLHVASSGPAPSPTAPNTTPVSNTSSTVNVLSPTSDGTGVQPAINTPIFSSPFHIASSGPAPSPTAPNTTPASNAMISVEAKTSKPGTTDPQTQPCVVKAPLGDINLNVTNLPQQTEASSSVRMDERPSRNRKPPMLKEVQPNIWLDLAHGYLAKDLDDAKWTSAVEKWFELEKQTINDLDTSSVRTLLFDLILI